MIEMLVVRTLVVVVLLMTLVPLVLRHQGWWVRGLEFPAIQITGLTGAMIIAYAVFYGWSGLWDKAALALLVLCVLLQMGRLLRFTPVFPRQIQTARQMRPKDQLSVVVANVLTPNQQVHLLLDQIEECEPDLVLAVETDDWWQSELESLLPRYPHMVKYPLDNLYGMVLFSRLELQNSKLRFLVQEAVPSIHTDVILASGHRVALHCLHPAPPSPSENPTSAERDGELLLVARTLDPQACSVVAMGDFNDVPWSPSMRLFQKLSGLLDPRVGRGMYNSFHAGIRLLRWPLDHVFCSRDFTLVSFSRLRHIGSDHFPIHVVLQHTPKAEKLHPEMIASAHESAEAESKINKVHADKMALM